MNKTLLKNFTVIHHGHQYTGALNTAKSDDIVSLVQEMKSFLSLAAGDLLQPRQEAVDRLLNSIRPKA